MQEEPWKADTLQEQIHLRAKDSSLITINDNIVSIKDLVYIRKDYDVTPLRQLSFNP